MFIKIILFTFIIEIVKGEKDYFIIKEETKIGTEILETSKLLKDKLKALSKFTIIGESNFKKCISIQQETGITTIAERIDREQLCNEYIVGDVLLEKCTKSLRIIIITNTLKEVLDLEFEIVDINDNAPIWSSSILRIQYPESIKKNPIKLPLAHDKDSGQNSLIKYSLKIDNTDNLNFNLESGENPLLLTPKFEIDYEHNKFYNLTLIAEDRGIPAQSNFLHVEITVVDINDNSPKFLQKVFRPLKPIYETMVIDSTLTKVVARDQDSGENSKISYYIDPSTSKVIENKFYINPITGEIKLKERLDYDRGFKSFSFVVIAKDNAPAPYELSSSATVEIDIVDVNDEIPKINIFLTNSPIIRDSEGVLSINISENINPQQYDLAHINIEDSDEDDKIFMNCFIDNKESFKLMPDLVKVKSFILSATKTFDREKQHSEHVKITCQDNGKNENSKEILIYITDENDNAPEFHQVYEFIIKENKSQRNQFVGQILALDKDSGKNAEITYKIISIQPRTYINFQLKPDNGKLYVDQALDREEQNHYNITVIAVDKGDTSLTGTGFIILLVEDVNDWVPTFDSLEYKFKVMEEVPINSIVGTVHATDKDIGKNAIISYHFIADSFSYGFQRTNSLEKFHINSETGILTTTGNLDRETKNSYLLIVEAMNPDMFRRYSTSTTVHISVLDYNDNSPRFYSPGNYSLISIDADRSIGSEIIQFRANDLDEHKNGNIVYTIVSTTDPQLFNLEFSSGILFLAKKVESFPKLKLSVRACDTGLPQQCSEDLTIFISTTRSSITDSDNNADYTINKAGLADNNGAIIACLVVIFVILLIAMIIMLFLIRNKQFIWTRRSCNNQDKSPQFHVRNMDSNFNKKDAGSICEDELLLNERNNGNNMMLNSMYPKIYTESQIDHKPDSPCYRTIDAMISGIYNPINQGVTDLDTCHLACTHLSKSHHELYHHNHQCKGNYEPLYRYFNTSGRNTVPPTFPNQQLHYHSINPSRTTTFRLKNNFNNVDNPLNSDLQQDSNPKSISRSISLMRFYEKQNENSEIKLERCLNPENDNRHKYPYEAFREGSFI